jgi:hypothetical protein
MNRHHRARSGRSLRPRRMLAGGAIFAIVLTGCSSSGVTLAPLGTDHPANPRAAAGPLPSRSTTLDPLPEVEADEQPSMPEGHHMHQHH